MTGLPAFLDQETPLEQHVLAQWSIAQGRTPEPAERPSWQSRVWLTSQLVRSALYADIPIITLWKAWDAPVDQSALPSDVTGDELNTLGRNWQGEGLIRADDHQDTEALRLVRADLGGRIEIFGINDLVKHGSTVIPHGSRDFEVYGLFPGASLNTVFDANHFFNYDVIALVDGERQWGHILGEYAGQINVRISFAWTGAATDQRTRWFSLQLRRRADGAVSNEHGPIPFQYW